MNDMRSLRLRTARLYGWGLPALGLTLGNQAGAQTSDVQLWTGLVVTGKITDRISFLSVLQLRREKNASRDAQFIIVPPTFSFSVTPRMAVSAGVVYAYIPGYDGAREDRERRFFQQIDYNLGNISGFVFDSYARFEQRRSENGGDLGLRVRSRLRVRHSLTQGSQKKPPIKGVITVEPFAYLANADWGPRKGFDQLRTYAGIELPLNKQVRLDLGYTNQFQPRPGPNETNHAVTTILVFRL